MRLTTASFFCFFFALFLSHEHFSTAVGNSKVTLAVREQRHAQGCSLNSRFLALFVGGGWRGSGGRRRRAGGRTREGRDEISALGVLRCVSGRGRSLPNSEPALMRPRAEGWELTILGDDGWRGCRVNCVEGNTEVTPKAIFFPVTCPHPPPQSSLSHHTRKQRRFKNSIAKRAHKITRSPGTGLEITNWTMEAGDLDTENASVSDAAPSRDFRIIYQKVFPFPARHDLIAWSPQLDLLAVVTDNGNVLLYRMNGQRVWGITYKPGNGGVERLQWRPDGR